MTPPPPATTPPKDDDSDRGKKEGTDEDEKDKDNGGHGRDGDDHGDDEGRKRDHGVLGRSITRFRRQDGDDNPFFTPNFDSDDPGFVDQPVFAEVNFTGASLSLLLDGQSRSWCMSSSSVHVCARIHLLST